MKTAISAHSRLRKHLLHALGAGIAGALALSSAQAAPGGNPSPGAPAVHVRYGDLNLATPDGVQVLYKRIAEAAWKVCPDVDQREIVRYAAARACKAQAIERAVREINSPRLAALAERIAKG